MACYVLELPRPEGGRGTCIWDYIRRPVSGVLFTYFPLFSHTRPPILYLYPYPPSNKMPATHIHISSQYPSFPRAHAASPDDQPPAYSRTPNNPPSYSLSGPNLIADRGNYAFAIMQHNLRFNLNTEINASPSPSPSASRTGNPTPPPPEPLPSVTPEIQPLRTTRAQKAALRDFEATQNPELWGRRVGHGRHARLIRDERQGFWAWLGELFIDEERGRAVVFSAGSPWGFIGTTGHI
jgi:hypothetical protein